MESTLLEVLFTGMDRQERLNLLNKLPLLLDKPMQPIPDPTRFMSSNMNPKDKQNLATGILVSLTNVFNNPSLLQQAAKFIPTRTIPHSKGTGEPARSDMKCIGDAAKLSTELASKGAITSEDVRQIVKEAITEHLDKYPHITDEDVKTLLQPVSDQLNDLAAAFDAFQSSNGDINKIIDEATRTLASKDELSELEKKLLASLDELKQEVSSLPRTKKEMRQNRKADRRARKGRGDVLDTLDNYYTGNPLLGAALDIFLSAVNSVGNYAGEQWIESFGKATGLFDSRTNVEIKQKYAKDFANWNNSLQFSAHGQLFKAAFNAFMKFLYNKMYQKDVYNVLYKYQEELINKVLPSLKFKAVYDSQFTESYIAGLFKQAGKSVTTGIFNLAVANNPSGIMAAYKIRKQQLERAVNSKIPTDIATAAKAAAELIAGNRLTFEDIEPYLKQNLPVNTAISMAIKASGDILHPSTTSTIQPNPAPVDNQTIVGTQNDITNDNKIVNDNSLSRVEPAITGVEPKQVDFYLSPNGRLIVKAQGVSLLPLVRTGEQFNEAVRDASLMFPATTDPVFIGDSLGDDVNSQPGEYESLVHTMQYTGFPLLAGLLPVIAKKGVPLLKGLLGKIFSKKNKNIDPSNPSSKPDLNIVEIAQAIVTMIQEALGAINSIRNDVNIIRAAISQSNPSVDITTRANAVADRLLN